MGDVLYVGHRVALDDVVKKVESRAKSNPSFTFEDDEIKHINLAFSNVGIEFPQHFRWGIKSVTSDTPMIYRTPYSIKKSSSQVVARNLYSGIDGRSRVVATELNGFSGQGFTLAQTEDPIALRYQIEEEIGGLSSTKPDTGDLKVKVLEKYFEPYDRQNDQVVYFDNIMVPLHVKKRVTTRVANDSPFVDFFDLDNYYLYTANGGVVVDGFFGQELNRFYSNISDMEKIKKQMTKTQKIALGVLFAAALSVIIYNVVDKFVN